MSRSAEYRAKLRRVLEDLKIDAFLVPHEDRFLSEYTAPGSARLGFITGFTGSAGLALISGKYTDLFTDGRYTIQSRIQCPDAEFRHHNFSADSIRKVLAELGDGGKIKTIGYDPEVHSWSWIRSFSEFLETHGISLVPVKENPVDGIWDGRPADPRKSVILYEDRLNGESAEEKIASAGRVLRSDGLDCFFVSDAESVNWLLNIRGDDIPCLPVVQCFAVIYSTNQVDLFVDNSKVPLPDFTRHVGSGVNLYEFSNMREVLGRPGHDSFRVGADPAVTSAAVIRTLLDAGARVIMRSNPLERMKAIKNSTEIEGERTAHLRDAVAMCRFLSWLDRTAEAARDKDSTISEATIADQMYKFRSEQANFVELSFPTISALGPNSAICHYDYSTSEKPRILGKDGIYLVDSGSHYLEGTTDITRTVKVGDVTDEVKEMFTRVLKGNIDLALAIFPEGTSGIQLDAIARRPLWEVGADFMHGTGHGVGHLLSVHEGPQCISSRRSTEPLAAGMITSDEPGYYREDAFGIRCENLLLTVPKTGFERSMLGFEVLTLVPFDTRLIKPGILSSREIEWLNGYHAKVLETVGPSLSDVESSWLLQATAPIKE